jgi:hypothetical protein
MPSHPAHVPLQNAPLNATISSAQQLQQALSNPQQPVQGHQHTGPFAGAVIVGGTFTLKYSNLSNENQSNVAVDVVKRKRDDCDSD